ncbi:alkaline serine protease [Vibrio azureus]|uniref:Putative alkaline serine protease n=2 Tax=Vibrio azureus TaxID=512649 RepID=U3C881_9VIBR|nr:S8 family peptidase [Vibrio azureus]AUI86081.1 alkaline serine protease [Vibrio azureus]GAD74658.1 putative alkaline serine protease [Vibrio azureus NBRC 104587]
MLKKVLSCYISSAVFMCSSALAQQELASYGNYDDQASVPLLLAPMGEEAITGKYIIVLKSSKALSHDQAAQKVHMKATINDISNSLAIFPEKIFEHSISGFVANLTQSQIELLRKDRRVSFIEQDRIISIDPSISEDEAQGNATWGLDRIDQRNLPLDSVYNSEYDGTGVTAYVIDTGVNNEHEEFGSRARSGYDFVDNDDDASDCNGHGTHVAGTIGGKEYGVAKNVNIVGVRVLSCRGSGSLSGVISGIEWVAENASGPSVANMSLGGGKSVAIDSAVESAIQSGVTFMLAAGNSNADACSTSPARVESGVTVGSTTKSDSRSSFSNWGSCVDLFAPGSDIKSAWYDGGYKTISGTSMATPHVAGVAALYLQENNSLSPQQVSDLLVSRATDSKISDTKGTANKLLYSLTGNGCEPDCGGPNPPNPPVPTPNPSEELISGLPVNWLSASSGDNTYFHMDLEAGKQLTVVTIGGFGNADMYLKFGEQPTLSSWDCRPLKNGNNETCTIEVTQSGRYHVMLNAKSWYLGMTIQANY